MLSADGVSGAAAASAKGKEERKAKNVIRAWKRERDAAAAAAAPPAPPARPRKEKPGDGPSPPPSVFLAEHHLCRDGHGHCAAPDARILGDNGANSGASDAIVVRRQLDDTPAAKKHRAADKVGNTGVSRPHAPIEGLVVVPLP